MTTAAARTDPMPEEDLDVPSVTARHFGLAVVALAMGGFAIGTTEFVTMGLLPQISAGVDVSIPTGGHVISAYAVGVVVGAPVLAFLGARLPRRALLVALMAAFAVGNAVSALATSYEQLMLARFAAGLPHGAYFGVASLVAASLAPPSRKGRAVAQVMLGLSVANVVGVPAATLLGQELGWRSAFWASAVLALATLALLAWFVPSLPGDPAASGRRELAAFKVPQVWLTLLAGAVGFGGMFAVYSYIAPVVTDVAGLGERAVPVFLLSFGLGMVAGTFVAGIMADWSIFRSLIIGGIGMAGTMLAFWVAAPHGWASLPVVFLITLLGSVLVVNLQLRLMDVAGDAQTLGAAMNHASLNIANALGAWLGGLVIAAGWGLRAPALVGLALSLAGVAILLLSAALHVRGRAVLPG
ncbi:MFS transporter, DHA1 family, inner membrane transport protein [Nocardioides alpinus]|uniref:MFS transporter, DHA1 family, inner membrane transport protein n=2 Tax=Nocardioides alpinus TaxID=748909 RepID=A0A1I1ABX2_9ACTN|nr:MFS transporter [Nocardioides alpinus]SFB35485.1 MFS transporter, DHA1 family, inner membrane transport protein [Nocardioides alpinus]